MQLWGELMAEDDSDAPEGPSLAEPSISEPAAVALEEAASVQPETRSRAARLIEEQIKLASLQREHLKTQHIRDRFLVAFDLTLAVCGLVVLVIVAALFWDAVTSRSVIILPFDVPADLAAEGRSGKVVATELLGHLRTLQDATRSDQAKRSVSDAWSNRIELQIPEVGISIDEVENLLHRWLSHDEHISGSVTETGDRIAVAIQGDNISYREFDGGRGGLDSLLTKAAEYVYGESEPYLFAVYLFNQGRYSEVIAFARSKYPSADASDKPRFLSVWANALFAPGRYQEALEKLQEAVRLKPDFWLGYDNMMGVQQSMGEEEAMVQTGREMERRAMRHSWAAAKVPPGYWENLDYMLADWPSFHADEQADMAESGGRGTQTSQNAPLDAWSLAQMHDRRAAEIELETSPGTEQDNFVVAQSAFVRAYIALDRRQFADALKQMRIVKSIASKDSSVQSAFESPAACWLALAEFRAGEGANADSDIRQGGHYVDCYTFKGDIAEGRGQWSAAQKDYAAAVALAPSMPSPYESWGEALARRGRYAEAIVQFRLAQLKGPHWADPLEHWGEALAALGRFPEAVAKYQEAAIYAPQWGTLYLDWGRALDRLRQHASALEKFKRAWDLDLTAAERASIYGCCG